MHRLGPKNGFPFVSLLRRFHRGQRRGESDYLMELRRERRPTGGGAVIYAHIVNLASASSARTNGRTDRRSRWGRSSFRSVSSNCSEAISFLKCILKAACSEENMYALPYIEHVCVWEQQIGCAHSISFPLLHCKVGHSDRRRRRRVTTLEMAAEAEASIPSPCFY